MLQKLKGREGHKQDRGEGAKMVIEMKESDPIKVVQTLKSLTERSEKGKKKKEKDSNKKKRKGFKQRLHRFF